MSLTPPPNPTGPVTGTAPALSVDLVAALLYLLYTPAQCRALGPVALSRIVTGALTDPAFRLPEITALVLAAEAAGTLSQPQHLATARAMARRVLATR